MRYAGYNRMYYKGKAIGHKYRTEVGYKGGTRAALKRRIQRNNRIWNRVAGKGKYRAKLVAIKKVKR